MSNRLAIKMRAISDLHYTPNLYKLRTKSEDAKHRAAILYDTIMQDVQQRSPNNIKQQNKYFKAHTLYSKYVKQKVKSDVTSTHYYKMTKKASNA